METKKKEAKKRGKELVPVGVVVVVDAAMYQEGSPTKKIHFQNEKMTTMMTKEEEKKEKVPSPPLPPYLHWEQMDKKNLQGRVVGLEKKKESGMEKSKEKKGWKK